MATTVAFIPVVPLMTWLLVSTRPDLVSTMPVAAAVPPWKPRLLVMSTRPGWTLL